MRETARLMGVSHQRVRYLLGRGRLCGERDQVSGEWVVFYGLPVSEGRRGPVMKAITECWVPSIRRRKRHGKVLPAQSPMGATVDKRGRK